jgi:hypothetical protein
VLRAGQAGHWPFDAVCDPEGALCAKLGLPQWPEQPAFCVTDRWGEVFFSGYIFGEPERQVEELLSWLDFVERQCPECFPSEWPD